MANGKRIRDYLEVPSNYPTGTRNAITDVKGVRVGHATIHNEKAHTGVTIIAPHEKDPYRYPTPCAVAVGNGYGKLTGSIQVEELGVTESYIGLTNTFSVAQVVQGLLENDVKSMRYTDGSMNILVGETNDSYLSDMRGFHVRPEHVFEALRNLSEDVEEGAVGAGAGTACYGYKGGIGTASRKVEVLGKTYTVGALLQTNFGGHLNIYGREIRNLPQPRLQDKGSCMIVVATDAPLCSRQLKRLARRGIVGITHTGSFMSNGSGDFCIAFSNCADNLYERSDLSLHAMTMLPDDCLSPLFDACAEAVRESVYNSLAAACDLTGFEGRSLNAIDLETLLQDSKHEK